ncbi:MAG: long-chain fatty acid--CoA ligase [Marinilabiliales bacterium]|nr:MAG: long-chain fatty acid--CoA ligase [Marinilabiliales bacterium]
MTEVKRIFDLLPYMVEKYPDLKNAIVTKSNDEWIECSVQKYKEMAELISYGLLSLGVRKGDKIASISSSRTEWNWLDMGIMQIGAVHVPIYPTISEDDHRYILAHSETKYVFTSGVDMLRRIEHLIPEVPNVAELFTFDEREGVRQLEHVIELGRKAKENFNLEEYSAAVDATDLATMIYTSGTTGTPKGVMLSHRNLVHNFTSVSWIMESKLPPYSKIFSYLPLCHVYERMINYSYQYLGYSINYAESIAKISDNLKEIKPDMMCSVPRLMEKTYDKIIMSGRKLTGIKKQLFFWAVNLGHKYELDRANGWWYHLKLSIADKLIFSKWRAALGGKLQIIVSGGAAIQPRLARIFTAAKIDIMEGYGLTESSPVIAVNNFEPDGREFGTVGPPTRGVEVKIAQDGEVLTKSPCVMMGYYKAPELTKEVIDDDGWLHTGDMGELTPKGLLKITGRKKAIFKNSFGKYINPEFVENKLKESPFIDNAMVVGENQKFAAALIIPNFGHLRSWCKVKNIEYSLNEEMIQLPRIKDRIKKEISEINKGLGSSEKISNFELMAYEWSVDTGELSAALKIRRHFVFKKYNTQIERLFN